VRDGAVDEVAGELPPEHAWRPADLVHLDARRGARVVLDGGRVRAEADDEVARFVRDGSSGGDDHDERGEDEAWEHHARAPG